MKNLIIALLICAIPALLYSDPCPDDTTPPVIVGKTNIWDCTVNIFEDPDSLFITVTEESECGLRVVEMARWDLVKGRCSDDFIQEYTVVWYAEDMAGNATNFTQVISIPRPTIEEVEFPQDTMVQCPGSGYDQAELFGYPTINGHDLTDLCGFRFHSKILDTLPTMNPVSCLSEVRKEWTIIEQCSGIVLKDTQEILLIDTIRPIIACSALEDTVELVLTTESCAVSYTFPEVDAIDFCAADEELVFNYLIDDQVVGSEVALLAGSYKGSVVVSDPCNNADTCYYTIIVRDATPPVVTCGTTEVALTETTQSIPVEDLPVQIMDCTDGVALQYRFSDQSVEELADEQIFTCDMAGGSPVSIVVVATDTSGNVSEPVTCSIYVNAEDVNCPTRRSTAITQPVYNSSEMSASKNYKAYITGQRLVVESETGMKGLALFNTSGRLIWQKQWNNVKSRFETQLPDHAANGLYFLKIIQQDGQLQNISLAAF